MLWCAVNILLLFMSDNLCPASPFSYVPLPNPNKIHSCAQILHRWWQQLIRPSTPWEWFIYALPKVSPIDIISYSINSGKANHQKPICLLANGKIHSIPQPKSEFWIEVFISVLHSAVDDMTNCGADEPQQKEYYLYLLFSNKTVIKAWHAYAHRKVVWFLRGGFLSMWY